MKKIHKCVLFNIGHPHVFEHMEFGALYYNNMKLYTTTEMSDD